MYFVNLFVIFLKCVQMHSNIYMHVADLYVRALS